MLRQNYTNDDCREFAERLLSTAAVSPEGRYGRLLDKTLLGFSLEEKWIDFEFTVDDRHLNVIGTVHGGIMAGLADECMGFGAASLMGLEDEVLTTSDMQFNCMKQYSENLGPLSHQALSSGNRYRWLDDPWPWEYAANKEG